MAVTADTTRAPYVFTIWVNGKVASVSSAFAPVQSMYTTITQVGIASTNVTNQMGLIADFQFYCGSDLSRSNAAMVVTGNGTGTVSAPCLPNVLGYAIPSWSGGPPAYQCPNTRPLVRIVGGSRSFYGTHDAVFNSTGVLGGVAATMNGFVPSDNVTMFAWRGAVFATKAGNAGVTLSNQAIVPPYAISLWFSRNSYLPMVTGTGATKSVTKYSETLFTQTNGWKFMYNAEGGLCFSPSSATTTKEVYSSTDVSAQPLFGFNCTGDSPMRWPHYVSTRAGSDWVHVMLTATQRGYSGFVNGEAMWEPGAAGNIPKNVSLDASLGMVLSAVTDETMVLGDLQVYAGNDLTGYETNFYYGMGCSQPSVGAVSNSVKLAQNVSSSLLNRTVFSCDRPLHWFIGWNTKNGTYDTAVNRGESGKLALTSILSASQRYVEFSQGSGYFYAPPMYYGQSTSVVVSAWLYAVPTSATYAWMSFFTLGNGLRLSMSRGQTINSNTFFGLCVTRYVTSIFTSVQMCPDGSLYQTPAYVQAASWVHIAFQVTPVNATFFVNGDVAFYVPFQNYSAVYGNATLQRVVPIGISYAERTNSSSTILRLADMQVYVNSTFVAGRLFDDATCGSSLPTYPPPSLGSGVTFINDGIDATYQGPWFTSTCYDIQPIHSIAQLQSLDAFSNGGITPIGMVATQAPTVIGQFAYVPSLSGYALSTQTSNRAAFLAPITTYSGGFAMSFWLSRYNSSFTTQTYQVIAKIGDGLYLAAYFPQNSWSINLCVIASPDPQNVLIGTQGGVCSSVDSRLTYMSYNSTSANILTSFRLWMKYIHIMFSADTSNLFNLYVNGLLVATNSSFTQYRMHYGRPTSVGILHPATSPMFLFSELHVYGSVPYPAGEFFGTRCKQSIHTTVADIEMGRPRDGLGVPVTFMRPKHSYMETQYPPSRTRPAYSNEIVDATTSRENWFKVPGTGTLTPSMYGFGWDSGPNTSISFVSGDYGADYASGESGRSLSFWLYRSPEVANGFTRLLTVPGPADSVFTFDVYVASQPYYVQVTWPGCAGARFFDLRKQLNITGIHYVVIAFGVQGVTVFIDGEVAPQTMALDSMSECSRDLATWPQAGTFLSSGPYVKNTGTNQGSAFSFLNFAVFYDMITQDEVSARWNSYGIIGQKYGSNSAPPPPYVAMFDSGSGRALTACEVSPPAHRYGEAVPYPFRGGVLTDGGAVGGWDAPWLSNNFSTIPLENLPVVFNTPGSSVLNRSAYIDLGTQTFNTSSGMTFGFLVSSPNLCQGTVSTGYAPSSLAYFDIGGFSMYSVGPNCSWPYMTTYLTSPGGATESFAGTQSLPIPMAENKYTFVVFGTEGIQVYVGSRMWLSAPLLLWDYTSETFTSTRTRFFGGNLRSPNITVRDLQFYNFALSAGQIAGLDRGVTFIC